MTITNVPSTITVTKTANPTVVQDSGPVTFTVVVRNNSAVDTVYIQTLTDSIYGDLNGKGTCTLEDGIAAGPAGSRQILPGASYTCTFTATVSHTETDLVTATGVDDDDQPVSDDDDATVTVNHTPPPPHIPATDISVTKAATPAVQLPQGGGTAPITYNLVVKNNGPDAAANVKVSDAAPANVSFVSATTSAGSCTTTAQALDCTITSLAPGASIAITVNATVNATGTKVNVVIVTTTTPETNTGNNTAQASTVVTAPVTPPTPKPQPEDLRATHRDPEGAEGEREGAEDQCEGDEGEEACRRSEGQDHGPGDQQDGQDRQERQGDGDRETGQAGHHPRCHPGREYVQHPANRCCRRLRAAGHRVTREPVRQQWGGAAEPPLPFLRRAKIRAPPNPGDRIPRTRVANTP